MKKIFMLAATAAVALSSCSKNEVLDVAAPNENPDAIGLSMGAFATKAGMTTTATLQGSTAGVTLYSQNDVLNEMNFKYNTTTNEWAQNGTDKKWSAIDDYGEFGIVVYSMHDGVNPVAVAPATGIAAEFTVAATPATQQDLVHYVGVLSARPTNSKISAVFEHSLSRIMMTQVGKDVTTGNVYVAPASMISLVNYKKTSTPTIELGGLLWDITTTPETFEYDAAADMYMIPYITACDVDYDVNAATLVAADDVYVESLFYSTIDGKQNVGYKSVADYIKDNQYATVKDSSNADYDGVMYVCAGFPLNNTFVAGKYYNLNLNYFGADLFITKPGYYDVNGDKLTITKGEEPSVTDPVNPSDDDLIGLTVTVNEWPAVDPDVEL